MGDNLRNEVAKFEKKIENHPAYRKGKAYKWSPKDFDLGIELGRGGYGRVHMAKEKRTGHIVAMKVLFKSRIEKMKCEKSVLREIEIQSALKHPHILRLLTWFHDERRIYIVIEYAEKGELYKLLKKSPNGRFSEKKAAKYIYQIADAMEYCHMHQVMHRDIKPENILVDHNGDIKLADFGCSVHAPSNRRQTLCGTLDYLPPEMIKNEEYNSNIDQWSIGILLYEFLVGNPPFVSSDQDITLAKILALDIEYPQHISACAKDLISKLLKIKAEDRLSVKDIKSHEWVRAHYTPVGSTSVEPEQQQDPTS